jgi:hypothetical protein
MVSSFPDFAGLRKGQKRTFIIMDLALAFMFRACKLNLESEQGDSDYESWLHEVLGLDYEKRLLFCRRNQPVCLEVISKFNKSQLVFDGPKKPFKLALGFIKQVSESIEKDLHRKKFRRAVCKVAIGSKKYLLWSFIADHFQSQKWLRYFKQVLFTESYEFLFGEPLPDDEFISDEPFPESSLGSSPFANLLAEISATANEESNNNDVKAERLEIILSIWRTEPANVAFTNNPGEDYLVDIFLMTRWPDVSDDSIREWLNGAEPSEAISRYLEV